MTKDEIIEIANKVKLPYDYVGGGLMWLDKLEHFAKLVAYHESKRLTDVAMKAAEKAVDVAMAIEREACAKIAEEPWQGSPKAIAELIRARGQK